jgi:Pvc16 N-terminal domain
MNAVSHALVELLRREVLGEAVPVSLDAPNKPWTQAAVRPTVNLFLYDVRENLARREVMLEPVRDSSGVVVGRRTPPTRYDLHYLLSVWGAPVELEYQVLSALVVGLGAHSVLSPELFEHPDPNAPASFLTTAAGMKRGMLPMFSGELKMQVELTVATPVPVSAATFVAGPPVREPARITVLDQSPEEITAARKGIARMPHPRVAQDDPRAAVRAAIAAAVEALPPPPPAKPPAPGGPPGARPPGAATGGARPPGAAPGGARPGGAPPSGPPGSAAPGAARPAGAPPGAAGPPKAAPPPLVQLRAALAQAAQAQAVLAQAVASLATMLPAGSAAQAPARPAAGPPPAQGQPPAAAAGQPPAQGQPPAAAAGQPPAAAARPAPEAPAQPSVPSSPGLAPETTP